MADKAGNVLTLISSGIVTSDTLIVNRGDDGGAPDTTGNPRRMTFASLFALAAISTLAGGTLTASAPMTLTQTWNNGAVAFTALKVNATNTASSSSSLLIDLQVGGASKFAVNRGGDILVAATGSVSGAPYFITDASATAGFYGRSNTALFAMGVSDDCVLRRDAADTFAIRRSTNEQTLNIYNTYTDASNYERAVFQWATNVFYIGTSKGGTGLARALRLIAGGIVAWEVSTGGHLLAVTDNTYDIGESGATRPKNLYLAGSANIAGSVLVETDVRIGDARQFYWGTRAALFSPADGVIRLTDTANTDFNRLQFGGTTSSFPSLKRSAAELHARLADDSADTVLQVSALKVATIQVVGAQGAAVADATDAASAITQLNALLARTRTHGLIAT